MPEQNPFVYWSSPFIPQGSITNILIIIHPFVSYFPANILFYNIMVKEMYFDAPGII